MKSRNLVILMGGKSSRMGQDKAQMFWRGKPLIDHQISLARELNYHLYLSINEEQKKDYSSFNTIVDKAEDIGPIGGIYSALKAIQESCLFIPIDMPFLTQQVLSRLSSRVKNVCYQTSNSLQPLPSLWHPELLPKIEVAMAQHHYALYQFIQENNFETILTDQMEVFRNFNYPEDLE